VGVGAVAIGAHPGHHPGVSLRYEPLRLLLRLALALSVAVAAATVWAIGHGGGFQSSLSVGCYLIGALVLLPAFAGETPSRRDASGWMVQAASRSSFRVDLGEPPEHTLAPGAVFVVVAVALFLLGWAIG
jgi:hypothetical protein